MGRRKIQKEAIRKIQNSKGSYYVTLPVEEVRKLKWKESQKVVVKRSGKKFIINDWPARKA